MYALAADDQVITGGVLSMLMGIPQKFPRATAFLETAEMVSHISGPSRALRMRVTEDLRRWSRGSLGFYGRSAWANAAEE